jgi:hypothetical protein
MKSVTLKFPVGLSVDIRTALNPIKTRIEHLPCDPEITVEYIGCEDNWKDLLKTIRYSQIIKVIAED